MLRADLRAAPRPPAPQPSAPLPAPLFSTYATSALPAAGKVGQATPRPALLVLVSPLDLIVSLGAKVVYGLLLSAEVVGGTLL